MDDNNALSQKFQLDSPSYLEMTDDVKRATKKNWKLNLFYMTPTETVRQIPAKPTPTKY